MKIKIYDLKSEHERVFADQRGWLASIINGNWPLGVEVKNIHVGSIEPGQIRGNHFHEGQREWMIIFGGQAVFYWRDEDGVGQKEINEKDLFLFELEAGIGHAIKNTGINLVYLVAASNAVHDHSDPDTVRDVVISQ